uniref:Uncharacterized protein n=1 Tax=Cacopsylla melanoneura TaxID=428564 RepID=A0A8D9ADY3_9HEMI
MERRDLCNGEREMVPIASSPCKFIDASSCYEYRYTTFLLGLLCERTAKGTNLSRSVVRWGTRNLEVGVGSSLVKINSVSLDFLIVTFLCDNANMKIFLLGH